MERGGKGEGPMKAMHKSELAHAAGVTPDTFRTWLHSDADYLRSQSVPPKAKILPPQVVAHLAEKHNIEVR